MSFWVRVGDLGGIRALGISSPVRYIRRIIVITRNYCSFRLQCEEMRRELLEISRHRPILRVWGSHLTSRPIL